MAAVTDFANVAAAQSAGYSLTQWSRVVGGVPTFSTLLEKTLSGGGTNGGAGFRFAANGESTVSQAAADTNALTALNAQRRAHYGGAPGRASGDGDSPHSRGGTHVIDAT